MAPTRNVVVFGEPSSTGADSKGLVIELAGAERITDLSPQVVFEARKYYLTISNQLYTFHNTAGLVESTQLSLDPRIALRNLYHFTHSLSGGINLLIYVVAGNEPTSESSKNFRLFYHHLCQEDTPIVLVRTNRAIDKPPDRLGETKYKRILSLSHGGDQSGKDRLIKAIQTSLKSKPKLEASMELFGRMTSESWALLERSAGWTLVQCVEALKDTLVTDAQYSNRDADKECDKIKECIKRNSFRNVIVFGNTGAGRTSVINMLTKQCAVEDSASSAGGSTRESKAYRVDIGGYHCMFHDTVGLSDATSSDYKALQDLIAKVKGSISLFVYVHRGRIEQSKVDNYKKLNAMCPGTVPIALVVTGLEEEKSRDEWWKSNKHLFERVKIQTEYSVCITSTKGKFIKKHGEFAYQDEYDESTKSLKDLFRLAALPGGREVGEGQPIDGATKDHQKELGSKANLGWHFANAKREATKLVGSFESVISRERSSTTTQDGAIEISASTNSSRVL